MPHLSENPARRALLSAALILPVLAAVPAPISGAGAAAGNETPWLFADTTRVLADQPLVFDTNLGLIERATAEAVTEALSGLRLPPGSDIRLHALTNHEGSWFVEDFIARYLSDQGHTVHLVKKPVPAGTTPGTAPGPAGAGKTGSLAEMLGKGKKAPADSAAAAGEAGGAGAVADTAGVAEADGGDTEGAPETTPGGTPEAPVPRMPRRGPAARAGEAAGARVPKPEQLIPIPEGEGMVLTFRLVEFGVTYHDSWRRGFLGPRVVERLASVNLFCRLVSGDAEEILWVGRGKAERLDIVPKSRLDLLEGLSYPFTVPTLRQAPLSRLLEPVLVTGIVGGLVYLFYANQ